MGKKANLSDIEHGIVVGARQAGQSIWETADLLRFSLTIISRIYRKRSEKEKISSERQFSVDAGGQRRMARLVEDKEK